MGQGCGPLCSQLASPSLSAIPGIWPKGALEWKPLEGLKVGLCPAHSEPSAGTWAVPILAKSFYLPWTQSRPKSKAGLFLKWRPEVDTQRALCFGVEALKDLFSLNILLQERETQNQTFLKHEFQVALKEQFVWFPSHPVSAQWGPRRLPLRYGREGPHPSRLTHLACRGGFLRARPSLRVSGHSPA